MMLWWNPLIWIDYTQSLKFITLFILKLALKMFIYYLKRLINGNVSSLKYIFWSETKVVHI